MTAGEWLKIALVGRSVKRTLIRLCVVAVIAFVVFRFVFPPVVTRGVSMEPTFADGRLHFVNTLSFRNRSPRPGDIVVVALAGRRAMYLKRVLAGPGERMELRDGVLLVDGEVREEPYLVDPGDWTLQEVELGENEYFVAGDNRTMPMEEHKAGVVAGADIVGGLLF